MFQPSPIMIVNKSHFAKTLAFIAVTGFNEGSI